MNNKFLNLILITLILVIAMSITDAMELINFKWWQYVIAGFVLPNASIFIWLLIEWIRFDPNEE